MTAVAERTSETEPQRKPLMTTKQILLEELEEMRLLREQGNPFKDTAAAVKDMPASLHKLGLVDLPSGDGLPPGARGLRRDAVVAQGGRPGRRDRRVGRGRADHRDRLQGAAPRGSVRGEESVLEVLARTMERIKTARVKLGEPLVLEGDPARAIVDAADLHRIDLIVVGSRGLEAIAGSLLGSVTSDIVQRASCDATIGQTLPSDGPEDYEDSGDSENSGDSEGDGGATLEPEDSRT